MPEFNTHKWYYLTPPKVQGFKVGLFIWGILVVLISGGQIIHQLVEAGYVYEWEVPLSTTVILGVVIGIGMLFIWLLTFRSGRKRPHKLHPGVAICPSRGLIKVGNKKGFYKATDVKKIKLTITKDFMYGFILTFSDGATVDFEGIRYRFYYVTPRGATKPVLSEENFKRKNLAIYYIVKQMINVPAFVEETPGHNKEISLSTALYVTENASNNVELAFP